MIKRMASSAATALLPQCRFDAAVFILGHMRCGSTALAQVLCNHPAICGFGEAHLRYDSETALGKLALSQVRRKVYRPAATHLFDKVLHDRYDRVVDPGFYTSRAIFLIRPPLETIASIRRLFAKLGSHEFASDAIAADYYETRLETLARNWQRFPANRRLGLSYAELTADPDQQLQRISNLLGLQSPLENRYQPSSESRRHGVGDPLNAHRHDRIQPASATDRPNAAPPDLDLSAVRLEQLQQQFAELSQTVTAL